MFLCLIAGSIYSIKIQIEYFKNSLKNPIKKLFMSVFLLGTWYSETSKIGNFFVFRAHDTPVY